MLSANEPKPHLANMHVMIGSSYILHISETCQYNSNVLTLVATTYYVVGLFDVSEVC